MYHIVLFEMGCYICGKKYTQMKSRHQYETKNTIKLAEGKVGKYMLYPKRYCKGTMEVHSWKKHKENFKWVECKHDCNEVIEEVLKDHIKQHNIYYTKPEKLEDLLNTEHHNVAQATLKEFKEKRSETDCKILVVMVSRLCYLKDVKFQDILLDVDGWHRDLLCPNK